MSCLISVGLLNLSKIISFTEHIATQPFVEQEFQRKFQMTSDSYLFDVNQHSNIRNICAYEDQMRKDDESAM